MLYFISPLNDCQEKVTGGTRQLVHKGRVLIKTNREGNSLEVQWLGLGAFTAVGPGFNPW